MFASQPAKRGGLPGRMALLLLLVTLALLIVACQPASSRAGLPTRVQAALLSADNGLPATWTPVPAAETPTPAPLRPTVERLPTDTPRPLPTITPYTPPPSRTPTPSVTPTRWGTTADDFAARFGREYALELADFPRPAGNNGWGMHWIPTVKQEPGVVDRFVAEVVRMNIKWVVFLNDNTQIGDNDYLVDRLVQNGIMPVMRIYRSDTSPYDGDIGALVRHYRPRGVHYYQLYNEPNVNAENRQGFANPNYYATVWAEAAWEVIRNGGFPGLGALSPGGAYNHYTFLDRTLHAIKYNGDEALLGRTWLSVHNYHGTRAYDDPDGFLLFRKYDEIVRAHLWRSMPMIGTEGGSYSEDPQVEKQFLIFQYGYMRNAEPYLFAYSHWLLANREGGSFDPAWEHQTLFRSGWVHPVVTDFFYTNGR